jgi:uncharacterized protein involved in exopolysaccharide biosynthesis
MRTVLHWLVRLYPRRWLERYENEFRSLLDDTEPRLADLMDVLKQGVKMRLMTGVTLPTLALGMTAAAIAVLVLWLTPAPYESKATIAMRSAYFREYPMPEQMNLLTQRTTSREFLAKVIEEFNLYPDLRAKGEIEKAISKVRSDIRISNLFPQPALAVTNVSFRYTDPKAATCVTNALVTRLLDEQIRIQESTREATGDLFEKTSAFGRDVELLSSPSKGQRPPGPKPTFVVGLALAEGLQLGLIAALLRRRWLSPQH